MKILIIGFLISLGGLTFTATANAEADKSCNSTSGALGEGCACEMVVVEGKCSCKKATQGDGTTPAKASKLKDQAPKSSKDGSDT